MDEQRVRLHSTFDVDQLIGKLFSHFFFLISLLSLYFTFLISFSISSVDDVLLAFNSI